MNVEIKCEYTELVPTQGLMAHPKNANQHPEGQIEELAKLIQAHGWRVPIIVSKRSGCVVSGHGRWSAAKLIGMESVPVDYQDFETAEAEYLFVVSENAIGEWSIIDRAMVNGEIPDLGPFDISLLGLENFKVDVSESQPDQKPSKDLRCPQCEFRGPKKSFALPAS